MNINYHASQIEMLTLKGFSLEKLQSNISDAVAGRIVVSMEIFKIDDGTLHRYEALVVVTKAQEEAPQ